MLIFLSILVLFVNVKFYNNYVFATAENAKYAKALANCKLYLTDDLTDSIDNVKFIIPESYFVLIIGQINDNCYYVQYDKFVGYVESSTITLATFIPENKTLTDITCEIKSSSGTQIWSKPSATSGEVLSTISAGTKNINYIASIYGEIPSGGETNLWYFVSYTPITNPTDVYEGYIYSENTINLSNIPINNESNPELNNSSNSNNNNKIIISSSFQTIIIAIIAIPIILLISIILYKLIKKLQENTNKRNFQNDKYEKLNLTAINYYNHEDERKINLKSQIDNLSRKSFIRKKRHTLTNVSPISQKNYPEFPNYDSEDDLLWNRFLHCFIFGNICFWMIIIFILIVCIFKVVTYNFYKFFF